MNNLFLQKKNNLLRDLRMLALKHNRAYYDSLIPFIENASEDQEGLIDDYIAIVDEERQKLFHSREALQTVKRTISLLPSLGANE